MRLRDGTQDISVMKEVFFDNEYQLPEKFASDDIIVDVGAHIGVFVYACLTRGASRVVAFEPEPRNYALLKENVAHYKGVEVFQKAVWRSDKDDQVALTSGADHLTAMHQTLGREGTPVASVKLDNILRGLGKVSLLKLDCEYAEYFILYTSRELERVKEIVGEYHLGLEILFLQRECSGEGIARFLAEQGFKASFCPSPRCHERIGIFRGVRN